MTAITAWFMVINNRGVTINRGIFMPRFDFPYSILHCGMILSIRILMNRVDWLKNYVVKMDFGSVKSGDDLQIFTMNRVVFGAVIKNNTFIFFI
jgi:hypothetical protein